MKLQEYWDLIPIGYENRKTYGELCEEWGISKRYVRHILHQLAEQDNGDSFVLIRSAYSKGFYKTNDPDEIERYRREVISRAANTLSMLKKINRVQGTNENQLTIEIA